MVKITEVSDNDLPHYIMKKKYEYDIQEAIDRLLPNCHVFLDALKDNDVLLSAIYQLKKIVQKEPTLIRNLLTKQFRPTYIQTGTVGAFLFGCLQYQYGDVTKNCSPLCIGNLNFDTQHCEYQVWTQNQNGSYVQIQYSPTNHAYVYTNSHPLTFTISDIKKFKSSGIQFIQILSSQSLQHHRRTKLRNISQLPTVNNTHPTPHTQSNQLSKPFTITTIIILFLLFILFVALLLIQNQ